MAESGFPLKRRHMRLRNILFFFFAVCISLLAASHRWSDSAHTMGLVTTKGGKARHPAFFENGKKHYTMIVTAKVIPPYRGDARVVFEGEPKMRCEFFASAPVLDLNLRRLPRFQDNTFFGLQPKDRLALWVLMTPPVLDPVCGMANDESFIRYSYEGKEFYFCSEVCVKVFRNAPERYRNPAAAARKYTLTLHDLEKDKPILTVPVIFRGEGTKNHVDPHDH